MSLSLLVVGALSLAACGDDSVEPVADPPDVSGPTTSVVDEPDRPAFEHPTGADEVVISVEQIGGFVPVEVVFATVPSFLVSGDARQFILGPQPAIYPGPLLPNIQVSNVGEEGVQALLALAEQYGLLQRREYDAPTNIADASTTVVTIRVDGETFVHEAYALGLEAGLDETGAPIEGGPRDELAAFVADVTSPIGTESEMFQPDVYLVRATVVGALDDYGVEPTVVPWPDDVVVDLATSTECTAIAADAVGELFTGANDLTFFEQDDVIYRVTVKPALPGVSC